LIVLHDHPHGLAEQPTVLVHLIEGHLDPVLGRDAERRRGSRQRAVLADQDLIRLTLVSRARSQGGNAEQKKRLYTRSTLHY